MSLSSKEWERKIKKSSFSLSLFWALKALFMPGDIGQMSKYGALKKLHTVFIDSPFVPLRTKNS